MVRSEGPKNSRHQQAHTALSGRSAAKPARSNRDSGKLINNE